MNCTENIPAGKNENNNNLHSGPDGYDYRLWNVEEADDSAVTFVLMSPDGDQGSRETLKCPLRIP